VRARRELKLLAAITITSIQRARQVGRQGGALGEVLQPLVGALHQAGEALLLHGRGDLVQLLHVRARVDVRHVDLAQPVLVIAVHRRRLFDVGVLLADRRAHVVRGDVVAVLLGLLGYGHGLVEVHPGGRDTAACECGCSSWCNDDRGGTPVALIDRSAGANGTNGA